MGELRQVHVPDIGDFKDVPIIEIQVKPGDHVGVEAPLITLESDKASMEVPSPAAGVVKSLVVKVGDAVDDRHGVNVLDRTVANCSMQARSTKRPVSAFPIDRA